MAIQEIRVGPKNGDEATTVYCFEGIDEAEADWLRSEVLTDAIMQLSTLNEPPPQDVTRIGFKPGVMNPVEDTLRRVAQMYGINPKAVATYKEYPPDICIPTVSQVEEVVAFLPKTLLHEGTSVPVALIPIISLKDSDLEALSKTRSLFLNLQEMRVIADYFRSLDREPTDIELETLAQTWSEHNGHKTFKARLIDEYGKEKSPLIERIKETSRKFFERVGVVTAFKDNAGGIRFYDGWAIIGKWETHNSPVAIEPFGGAATKNGGVYRDIAGTGMGGVNLVGFMINNIASPETPVEEIPPGCLHPRHLLLENSRGERAYGNPMGIPTQKIDLHVHPHFVAKPTSMGGVIGLIPEDMCYKEDPHPGDLLISVGGKTGRDGVHGATFSSGEMTDQTQTVHATAVQLGNPIEEKRMFDALIAARDAGLIHTLTDCGGGGYSSAIGEMAQHVGVEVQLTRIPLKYQDLLPWEIWLSESQERMVVAVDPKNWNEFRRICQEHEVPADAIGRFTGDKRLTLLYHDEMVGRLPMEFLHDGLPQREMHMKYQPLERKDEVPAVPTPLGEAYMAVLGHWNIASTEEMLRQYDTTVQGTTIVHPFVGVFQDTPTDASVIAPLYDKPYGVVTAGGSNPVFNRINPYWGSVWAVTKAMSNFVAVGGNPDEAALIDNFVWPYPDAESLADLDKSVDALCDMMEVLHLPCVSGKDSLSSTYRYPDGRVLKIPPVLHVSVFGKIPDIEKTVTTDIKAPDSTLVLVGTLDADHLGGSVYFDTQGVENTQLPHVDINQLPETLRAIYTSIQTGNILSCHAIAEGGVAATLSEMCFGGDCGARVDISALGPTRPDLAFFNETAGCFLVEVANTEVAETLFSAVPHAIIGNTIKEKNIIVYDNQQEILCADLYDLKAAWQKPMKEVFF